MNKLSRKFLYAYLIYGAVCLLLVTVLGAWFIEKRLEVSISEKLYQNANRIAESELIKEKITGMNLKDIRSDLCLAADYPNSIIWLINKEGQIILSTRREDISVTNPITLKGFTPSTWGSNYYQIGDFYDYFEDTRLSVIVPVTDDMETIGYVAVHYLMSGLYQSRSSLLRISQGLFLFLYALLAFLLQMYSRKIHRPLIEITKGVTEFSSGNLTYQIPVESNDEMGLLAKNLNYMANKLDRNGEYQRLFISNVSHDFRSPLTSIKGYSNAILDGTIPPELQEKYLKIITYEADRLEKLTNGLLTLNNMDINKRMLHMESFDINKVIKSIAASFEGTCTRRCLVLELILYKNELKVLADMEQIQQVLYNLIHNAIKFSPDNSSIIIETTEKNNRIFISVKDHGVGIAKENLPKIWDRFYKSDSSRGRDEKGSGLGLAIVREIIQAHGQNINVISTQGVGSEFIFTLEKAEKSK